MNHWWHSDLRLLYRALMQRAHRVQDIKGRILNGPSGNPRTINDAAHEAAEWIAKLQDGIRWLISRGAKAHPDMMESDAYGIKDAQPVVDPPTVTVRKDDKWAGSRCPLCHVEFPNEAGGQAERVHDALTEVLNRAAALAHDLAGEVTKAQGDAARWRHLAEHAKQDALDEVKAGLHGPVAGGYSISAGRLTQCQCCREGCQSGCRCSPTAYDPAPLTPTDPDTLAAMAHPGLPHHFEGEACLRCGALVTELPDARLADYDPVPSAPGVPMVQALREPDDEPLPKPSGGPWPGYGEER